MILHESGQIKAKTPYGLDYRGATKVSTRDRTEAERFCWTTGLPIS